MRYKTGDNILIRYTREKAVIINEEDDGDFTVSVNGDLLQLSEEDFLPFEEGFDPFKNFKREKTEDEKWLDGDDDLKVEEIKYPEEIFLALEPYDEKAFGQKCFRINLVNATSHKIHFQFELNFKNKLHFKHHAELDKNSSFYLTDLFFDQLNDAPRVNVSAEWKEKKIPFRILKEIKLSVQKFLKPPQISVLIKTPAHVFGIFNRAESEKERAVDLSRLDSVILQSAFENKTVKSSHYVDSPQEETDLHIEKLKTYRGKISESEILELQLRVFDQYLERAIAHSLPRWKIIHGLGSGKLRQLIHHKLKQHPHVKYFTNQSDVDHSGGGVTFVFF